MSKAVTCKTEQWVGQLYRSTFPFRHQSGLGQHDGDWTWCCQWEGFLLGGPSCSAHIFISPQKHMNLVSFGIVSFVQTTLNLRLKLFANDAKLKFSIANVTKILSVYMSFFFFLFFFFPSSSASCNFDHVIVF
jgi:hypothetical protein